MKKSTLSLLFLALFPCSSVLTMNLPDEELSKLADEIVLELSSPEEKGKVERQEKQKTERELYDAFITAANTNDLDSIKKVLKNKEFPLNTRLTRHDDPKLLPFESVLINRNYVNNSQIISLLLEHGANPNAVEIKAYVPLCIVICEKLGKELVQQLVEAQANIFFSYKNSIKKPIENAYETNQKDILQYLMSVQTDCDKFKKYPLNFIAQTYDLNGNPLPNEIFLALMYRNAEFYELIDPLYVNFARNNKLNQAAQLLKKVNFTDKELDTYNALGLPTTKEALVNKYGHLYKTHAKTTDINFKFR